MEIRLASRDEVRPLQLAVLRPQGPLPTDVEPPDDWVHLAAETEDGVLGSLSMGPADWRRPLLGQLPRPAWELRRLAVRETSRRQGVGGELLAAARRTAAAAGAACLWAEARVAALPLYQRDGWTVVGPEWDKPGVGPHRVVWCELP